ncbi:MAG TPA: lysylphosphatidylglycerol synthase transmembrane domain-containing protein [Jatrophihabitans sp.]|nr:lysylphosphatidylglycerol synthase transmembrane domain-containing protein [Jatrophihabitans sp.]
MDEQVAGSAVLAGPAAVPSRLARRPRYVAIGIGFLLLAFASTFFIAGTDAGTDVGSVLVSSGSALLVLRWQFGIVLLGCAVLHYVAAGLSARAVMSRPAPWREVTLVQLAAAAANRITPAGLGGSAVNARYFSRRAMPVPAALGAVATLALLGAVADLLTGLVVIGLGSFAGIGGARRELSLLASYGAHLARPFSSIWAWIVLVALLAALGPVLIRRAARWPAGLVQPLLQLLHRPGRLLALLAASGATTLLLGCAFVCSVWMVPGARSSTSAGGLLIGFMLASAVSATVPVPAGLGSTEAALAAVLLTAHIPAAQAVQQVLLFRVVTFWAPAVVGLFVSRRLQRSGVL